MLEGPLRHTADRAFLSVPLGAFPELREGLAVTPHRFRWKEVPLKKADSSGKSPADRVGTAMSSSSARCSTGQDPCPSLTSVLSRCCELAPLTSVTLSSGTKL